MDQVTSTEQRESRIKSLLLDIAEIVDSFRTFPRFVIAAFAYLTWDTWQWYTHLPLAERTMDVTTFTGAVFGMAAAVTGLYLQGGRDWDKLEELKCSQK